MSGGGGGGGGETRTPNVPAAGPARPLGSYPQFNPLAYQGMTLGANPGMPGMGAPIASYMPAVNGMAGFGGGIIPQQLIQALMAGYAGVPSATQATGAGAPGMTTLPQPAPLVSPTPPGGTGNPKGGRRMMTSDGSGGEYIPGYSWRGYGGGEGDGGSGSEGGGTDGADSDGQHGADYGGGTDSFARGGMVRRLGAPEEWDRKQRVPDIRNAPTSWNSDPDYRASYKRGGTVGGLRGPDPQGPDDGYAALDRGEYVVRSSQAKKHKGTLAKINAGKYGNKSI
ncbi:MAG: hypothetical protein RJB58_1210 [Pseudomonadota bacterium]